MPVLALASIKKKEERFSLLNGSRQAMKI